MKNLLLLFIFFMVVFYSVQAQVNTVKIQRPKSNTDTLIFYKVNLRSTQGNFKGDEGMYFVNDSFVSKATYMKYSASYENIAKCVPCYLKTLDINDNVIGEGLQYTDCRIGSWKEYYSDGTIKIAGEYRKNLSGNWDNMYERGYCSKIDGEWQYFDEKGDFLYSEFWKEGEFVKQVPEQNVTEIWDVDLKYNDFKIGNQLLKTEQIKDLVIEPKFKNKSRNSIELKVELEISAIGYKPVVQRVSVADFKNIDVLKMLRDSGFSSSVQKSYTLSVYNNESREAYYRLNIKQ